MLLGLGVPMVVILLPKGPLVVTYHWAFPYSVVPRPQTRAVGRGNSEGDPKKITIKVPRFNQILEPRGY